MEEPGRILYADDDEKDVELTLMALGRHSLANEVVVVGDGEEVLDYLYCRGQFASRRSSDPVVVLLDLKMPNVDGLEVLRVMKSDTRLRTIPVVVLTSSREEKDVIESYKLGVNAYVVKPVGFEQFADAVGKVGLFWAVVNEPPPASASREKLS